MDKMEKFIGEDTLHEAFELGLIIKGFISFIEILGGIFLYFLNTNDVLNWFLNVTSSEVLEGGNHFFINYVTNFLQNFSVGTQHFAALYLFSHGLVKLLIVLGLYQKRVWVYPLSIVIFSGFTIYQFYLFFIGPSIGVFVIGILDILVVLLTMHEYKHLKNKFGFKKK